MMTNSEIIAIVTAYTEGKKIEFRECRTSIWAPIKTHHFLWDFRQYDYRIEPERTFKDVLKLCKELDI